MKTPGIICAVLLLGASVLFADETASLSYSLSGQMDARGSLGVPNDTSVFTGLSPFQEVSAQGAIEGKLLVSRGYAAFGLLDFTFRDANVVDHLSGGDLEDLSFIVNELYIDIGLGDLFYVRLGKQRLKWGTGYLFNPSDPVNPPKDPTAARATREGVPSLKAELITQWLSVAGFAVLYDTIDETGLGAKLSTSALPGTDLSLSGYWSSSESWTAALNASVAPFYELPGWDTIQLWVEGAAYDKGRYATLGHGTTPGSVVPVSVDGTRFSVLAGTTAQLPVIRTVLLAEYYHLGEGLSEAQLGSVYAALGSDDPLVRTESAGWYAELAQRPGRQASDYLFLSISQPTITDDGNPVFDRIGLQGSCLVNLVDGSFLASAGITTSFVEDSSIDLSATWSQGDEGTEFGNMPSRFTASIGLRVYY